MVEEERDQQGRKEGDSGMIAPEGDWNDYTTRHTTYL